MSGTELERAVAVQRADAAAYRYGVDLLRAAIAPNATDGELLMFSRVCERFQLSPFADQIVLIGRWDRKANREVHRHQITVAGRRALAERTGEFRGLDGPEWTGPRDERGDLRWVDLWTVDDAPPYAARAFAHREKRLPANGTAKWSEFAQRGRDGKLLQTWSAMPSHMLGKVAESMALRRAFPEVIEPALAEVDAIDLAGFDELEQRDPDLVEVDDANASEPRAVTPAEQSAAHTAIAALDETERDEWLARWEVELSEVWPAEAVIDALERPF